MNKKADWWPASQAGFSLLEIMIVMVIMGFLVVMVTPRFGGVTEYAKKSIDNSNQRRMFTALATYIEKTDRFPNKLLNLVDEAELAQGSRYQVPRISDNDPDNGAETLAAELYDRNRFHIHYLNNEEAGELRNMGIRTLRNLNQYRGQNQAGTAFIGGRHPDVANVLVPANNRKELMAEANVVAGLGVLMIGMGIDEHGYWIASNVTERGWGRPDHFGRIVLGIGTESSLLHSGIVANTGNSPVSLRNSRNITHSSYALILPRLRATVDRIDSGLLPFSNMDNDITVPGVQLSAISYDDAPAANYSLVNNDERFRIIRNLTLERPQQIWQYALLSPEGQVLPEDDGSFWAIDLNKNNSIE